MVGRVHRGWWGRLEVGRRRWNEILCNRERGSGWANRASGRDLGGAIVESAELAKNLVPLFPFLFRCVQAVPHVAQKLNLHDVDFLNRDSRHLRPCLVRVRVVVKKLVAEHQCDCQQSVFATGLALYTGVGLLQLPHEQKGQEDNILSDLCRSQNGCYPFAKSNGGSRIRYEGLYLMWRRIGVCDLVEDLGAFEPEQACDLR